MSDPQGPWQDYGQDDDTGEIAPRHLVGPPGPLPTRGFGADHRPSHTRATYRDDDAPPWTLREALDRAAWRYRTAPLWAKVSTDVAAASLVVVALVGVALLLRPDHDPQLAAADGSTTVPTVVTTTVPTTTTTSTTIPPTTTTTVATTTTTARRAAPPPTEPPPPPTEATTTTEAVRYDSCRDAFLAGALPLFAGDPGYEPRLDRDGDGEACEFDERNRG